MRITLDAALTFTPILGDAYEFLSGRVFLLSAGTLAAGCWKYFDIATNSFSGNLATTNLPATIATDSNALALSEQHVPSNRKPGEGFVNGGGSYDASGIAKNAIAATAAAVGSITGSGMPADLQANEYANFQVRIVNDALTPTSVGQRRVISSHTAGASGVFTLASSWTVTPSASALFVVENNDDLILLRSSATVSVYTYKIGANTWDTTTFAAAANACGAGVVFEQCFGIPRDLRTTAATRISSAFAAGARTPSTCSTSPMARTGHGPPRSPTAINRRPSRPARAAPTTR